MQVGEAVLPSRCFLLCSCAQEWAALTRLQCYTHTHLSHSRLLQTFPVPEAGEIHATGIMDPTSSSSAKIPNSFHKSETCGRATSFAECPQCKIAFCYARLARGHTCMCESSRQTHASQTASLFAGFIVLHTHTSLASQLGQRKCTQGRRRLPQPGSR